MSDKHYDEGGISTKDILQAKLTPEQYEGFLLGNIIKYSTRANFKDSFEDDVRKAGVYSKFLQEFEKTPTEISAVKKYGTIEYDPKTFNPAFDSMDKLIDLQELYVKNLFEEICDKVSRMLISGKARGCIDLLADWDEIRQPIHNRLFENKKEL